MLFKKLLNPDRQQTQLAYRVKYWPYAELSDAARKLISYKRTCVFHRAVIESKCDETMQSLLHGGREWKILWAFNNPPTEKEWKGKTDTFNIRAEFRVSPAIPEHAVVVLSWGLASDALRPTFPAAL
jgi:hypothetical protein